MSDEKRRPTKEEATEAAAGKFAHWLQTQTPQKPDGITDAEWEIYTTCDQQKIDPRIRDKVEAALGWKKDDVADAREIAEQILGAVHLAEKGHVPDAQLSKYRSRRRMADMLDSCASSASNMGETEDANALWALATKYARMAYELRVDIPREEDNGHHD